jgi:hypothetical protein
VDKDNGYLPFSQEPDTGWIPHAYLVTLSEFNETTGSDVTFVIFWFEIFIMGCHHQSDFKVMTPKIRGRVITMGIRKNYPAGYKKYC